MEIKFRGKRVKDGRWVFGGYHKHIARQIAPIDDRLGSDDVKHLIIEDGFADWNMPKELVIHEVLGNSVSQFSGKLDDGLDELFGNDVVRIHPGFDQDSIEGIVVFCKKALRWVIRPFDSSNDIDLGGSSDAFIEKIGVFVPNES